MPRPPLEVQENERRCTSETTWGSNANRAPVKPGPDFA